MYKDYKVILFAEMPSWIFFLLTSNIGSQGGYTDHFLSFLIDSSFIFLRFTKKHKEVYVQVPYTYIFTTSIFNIYIILYLSFFNQMILSSSINTFMCLLNIKSVCIPNPITNFPVYNIIMYYMYVLYICTSFIQGSLCKSIFKCKSEISYLPLVQ